VTIRADVWALYIDICCNRFEELAGGGNDRMRHIERSRPDLAPVLQA
jgi:hypothetical protein